MAKNETALTIIYKADNQASDKAGKIFRRMEDEMGAFQKQSFEASHSGLEAQLRDVEGFHAKMKARYEKMGDAYVAAEQKAREKLADMRSERGGARATPEIVRQGEEVKRIQAMGARNQELQAANEEALQARLEAVARQGAEKRAADLGAIERRTFDATHTAHERQLRDVQEWKARELAVYQNDAEMRVKIEESAQQQTETLQKQHAERGIRRLLGSARAMHAALGGVAIYSAYEVAQAGANAIEAQTAFGSAQASGQAAEMLNGRLARREAIEGLYGWIPGIGRIDKGVQDSIQDTKRQKALADRAEADQKLIEQLGQNVANLERAAHRGRTEYLGYTPTDMAQFAYADGVRARSERLTEARQVHEAAAADSVRAREVGLSQREQDAFALKESQAQKYLVRLEEVHAREEDYAQKSVQRVKQIEQASFWRGTEQAGLAAQFTGPNLAARQNLEMAGLLSAQKGVR